MELPGRLQDAALHRRQRPRRHRDARHGARTTSRLLLAAQRRLLRRLLLRLARAGPALPALHALVAAQGLPLHRGEPEVPYLKTFAPGGLRALRHRGHLRVPRADARRGSGARSSRPAPCADDWLKRRVRRPSRWSASCRTTRRRRSRTRAPADDQPPRRRARRVARAGSLCTRSGGDFETIADAARSPPHALRPRLPREGAEAAGRRARQRRSRRVRPDGDARRGDGRDRLPHLLPRALPGRGAPAGDHGRRRRLADRLRARGRECSPARSSATAPSGCCRCARWSRCRRAPACCALSRPSTSARAACQARSRSPRVKSVSRPAPERRRGPLDARPPAVLLAVDQHDGRATTSSSSSQHFRTASISEPPLVITSSTTTTASPPRPNPRASAARRAPWRPSAPRTTKADATSRRCEGDARRRSGRRPSSAHRWRRRVAGARAVDELADQRHARRGTSS